MNRQPLKTRLAPTPSGFLHQGNGLSFLLTWLSARARGGQVLLRIDDLDKGRRRPEYIQDIFETIDWLRISYDEGPAGPDDFYARWSQHLRLEDYQAALQDLRARNLLYACSCTRSQIRALSADGSYPLTCRHRNLPFDRDRTAWRINVPAGQKISVPDRSGSLTVDLSQAMGDFVVRQKNGLPAYQIASLADDVRFGINYIVRGMDLLDSTAAQLYLADQLGLDSFLQATFYHHELVTDEQGQKLSKSEGATALKSWREAGRSPRELYRQAARILGVAEGADADRPEEWVQLVAAAL